MILLIIGSLTLSNLMPLPMESSFKTQPILTHSITNFNVKITSKESKDPQIETPSKPQKVERPILPATGVSNTVELVGLIFVIGGLYLANKKRSEER